MRMLLVALFALVAGVSLGLVVAHPAAPKLDLSEELVSCELGNTGATLQALREFRATSSEAGLESLESSLSLHVVVLDEWLRELRPGNPEPVIKVLSAIAAY